MTHALMTDFVSTSALYSIIASFTLFNYRLLHLSLLTISDGSTLKIEFLTASYPVSLLIMQRKKRRMAEDVAARQTMAATMVHCLDRGLGAERVKRLGPAKFPGEGLSNDVR